MHIEISFGDVDASDSLRDRVETSVNKALSHVASRITRVEAHLRDDNAGKPGTHDKRCVFEARPAGHQPIAVEHQGEDLYQVIDETAQKLGRAVRHKLEKADAR